MSELGKWAAYRHEIGGLSWSEVLAEAEQDDRWANIDGLDWHKVRDNGRSYITSHKDEFPGKPGVEVKQSSDNVATVYYRGPQIQTPAELLDHIGWDRDAWQCVERKVKTYQQTSKREDTKLEYQDGAATGTVDKGGVITVTMFSVYVKLVRKRPIPIDPILTPIISSVKYAAPAPPSRGGLHRALIVADPQFGFIKRLRDAKLVPFHDRRVLDIALQIAAAAQPNRVMWPGDNFDMTNWTTRFHRAPEFYWTTRPAMLEGHWWFSQFRQLDEEMTIDVFDGNHEDRMRSAMQDHLPEALGLSRDDYEFTDPQTLELFHIAGLDSLGIQFVGDYPNGAVWLNERVVVRHGENSRMQVGDYVTIEGHYHSRGLETETRWNAKGANIAETFCPGCACSLDRVPGKNNHPDWQQGIALVDYDPNGTLYQIAPIPIHDGRAVWDGQVFTGRERVEELRSAWPAWNW